ncbi:hypothetical protein TNIN_309311 [Trichonephila inaurata madagascariensis]|uniref:Uncharacterized protein n=1 Tax=Trichonephila inaurata madagascariensis TaxID=2747483 RepID=A0A8X7BNZ6_9ARAC|nr:hypothetical protein TNIN_309311 [Trichonephila inaurata madagascariensis]
MGKTRCWKNALKVFSRKKIRKLDGNALLRYFNPLMQWLKKRNQKEKKGWKISDPMICPGEEDSDENTAATKISTSSLITRTRSSKTSTKASSGRTSPVSAAVSKIPLFTGITRPAEGVTPGTGGVTPGTGGVTPGTGAISPVTGATSPVPGTTVPARLIRPRVFDTELM